MPFEILHLKSWFLNSSDPIRDTDPFAILAFSQRTKFTTLWSFITKHFVFLKYRKSMEGNSWVFLQNLEKDILKFKIILLSFNFHTLLSLLDTWRHNAMEWIHCFIVEQYFIYPFPLVVFSQVESCPIGNCSRECNPSI